MTAVAVNEKIMNVLANGVSKGYHKLRKAKTDVEDVDEALLKMKSNSASQAGQSQQLFIRIEKIDDFPAALHQVASLRRLTRMVLESEEEDHVGFKTVLSTIYDKVYDIIEQKFTD